MADAEREQCHVLEAVRGPRETSTQREAAAPPGCWASPFSTLRVVFSSFTGAAAHPQHAGEGQPERLHREVHICIDICPFAKTLVHVALHPHLPPFSLVVI